jgi:hypothetical protein
MNDPDRVVEVGDPRATEVYQRWLRHDVELLERVVVESRTHVFGCAVYRSLYVQVGMEMVEA